MVCVDDRVVVLGCSAVPASVSESQRAYRFVQGMDWGFGVFSFAAVCFRESEGV